MRTNLILGMVAFLALNAFALDFDPYAGPKPVVALIETDPWLMVIGSDTPRLAIYENGLVIQKNLVAKKLIAQTTILSKDQLNAITAKLSGLSAKQKIEPYYSVVGEITDQPETKIFVALAGGIMASTVYGLHGDDSGKKINPNSKARDSLPRQLADVYEYLINLKFENMVDWRPDYFEALMWDYDYAPEASIIWPSEWPDLNSGSAKKRGDSYSLYLPGKYLGAFVEFLSHQNEKGAVEINKKKWAVSWKYVFPGEVIIRQAFK